ncbi:MAG: hypothetical protein A2X36_07625 [Elusimicrobia bacterium GWA2_69_24]|nr:MAG: hypothetical protein A2X36_07625 [Elusimicrobia bacterium GWA2_69_24]HBL18587.1 hypothetical protein [Elusimicrobiota bacterium]
MRAPLLLSLVLCLAASLRAAPSSSGSSRPRSANWSPASLEESRRLGGQGYAIAEHASVQVPEGRLAVVVYRKSGGAPRLGVSLVTDRGQKLLHMKIGSSFDIKLASIHKSGSIPDLAGDHSRIVAYQTALTGVKQESLILLRYRDGALEALPSLPFGRFSDIDRDGTLEIVSRERPLGQFFMIGCESYMRRAQDAFRTSIHAFRQGRVVRVSKSYPWYFDNSRQEMLARLDAIDLRSGEADPGQYLSVALSVYYDYQEMGRAREGWKEFRRLNPARPADPPPVQRCMKEVELTLRKRLKIPSDW